VNEYSSALNALTKVVSKGKSLDVSFLSSDSPLAKQLSYGVLRHYYELDAIVNHLLSKPLAKKHHDLKLLLSLGIYSIDHLKRPSHASVNAAVETTKTLKKPWAKGLINGVLRQYIREQDIREKLNSSEITSNHPKWLEERISNAYPDLASEIFRGNNTQAQMTLRVNTSKISLLEYQNLLQEADIKSSLGKYSPYAIILEQATSVENLPFFREGYVSVQDEASQLVAPLLQVKDNHRVLDACAAPGGKTCHILEINSELNQKIDLLAMDISQERLKLVEENLDRLGLSCNLEAADLMDLNPEQKFDRILLDAPCSATGIIRRHPDIKLLRRDEDIDKLASAQLELLAKAWSLLEEEGELVYTTCSILPTENENVISAFLATDASAQSIPIETSWGQAAGNGRQLLPNLSDDAPDNNLSTDGFFFAKLKKIYIKKNVL